MAVRFRHFIQEVGTSIHAWFFRKERTGTLLDRVAGLNRTFADLAPLAPANYIVRLKQEQYTMRRILIRMTRDLDNPFGYYERSSGEDVSLKPLEDTLAPQRRPGARGLRRSGGVSRPAAGHPGSGRPTAGRDRRRDSGGGTAPPGAPAQCFAGVAGGASKRCSTFTY